MVFVPAEPASTKDVRLVSIPPLRPLTPRVRLVPSSVVPSHPRVNRSDTEPTRFANVSCAHDADVVWVLRLNTCLAPVTSIWLRSLNSCSVTGTDVTSRNRFFGVKPTPAIRRKSTNGRFIRWIQLQVDIQVQLRIRTLPIQFSRQYLR